MKDLAHLRRLIINTAATAKEGHIPSALSILDILHVLYAEILTADDKFILSKGHGCLALYAVLFEKGVISCDMLDQYCKSGQPLWGHPERNLALGIEATTGSLGHGLPMACGMALAKKIKGESGRIYCLVGDQELNEGSCWEAIMLAKALGLKNLVVIVDDNRSSEASIPMGDFHEKFSAFGWATFWCDGHDHERIKHALAPYPHRAPLMIVAKTVKGHGCAVMEAEPRAWHHRSPTAHEIARVL